MAAYLWSHQTFHASALQRGTEPIYSASPAHPHLHGDSRAIRKRWRWKANYLLTYFHICIYICATDGAVPGAHMSLLITCIFTPFMPSPPLSLFLGIHSYHSQEHLKTTGWHHPPAPPSLALSRNSVSYCQCFIYLHQQRRPGMWAFSFIWVSPPQGVFNFLPWLL